MSSPWIVGPLEIVLNILTTVLSLDNVETTVLNVYIYLVELQIQYVDREHFMTISQHDRRIDLRILKNDAKRDTFGRDRRNSRRMNENL